LHDYLSPIAIHIACAERAGCDVLLAYDSVMVKQTHPTISIEWPREIIAESENLRLTFGEPQTLLALESSGEKERA
jgi:hypothetical protein